MRDGARANGRYGHELGSVTYEAGALLDAEPLGIEAVRHLPDRQLAGRRFEVGGVEGVELAAVSLEDPAAIEAREQIQVLLTRAVEVRVDDPRADAPHHINHTREARRVEQRRHALQLIDRVRGGQRHVLSTAPQLRLAALQLEDGFRGLVPPLDSGALTQPLPEDKRSHEAPRASPVASGPRP